MHIIDIFVFIIYFIVMLGVGIYFFRKNKSVEEEKRETLENALKQWNSDIDATGIHGLSIAYMEAKEKEEKGSAEAEEVGDRIIRNKKGGERQIIGS